MDQKHTCKRAFCLLAEVNTNNGAEAYHKKIKAYIKTPHPRIWSFIDSLNKIIADYDTDLQRLQNGVEITRIKCKKDKDIAQVRAICRERLRTGDVSPLQYLYYLRETIEELRPEDQIPMERVNKISLHNVLFVFNQEG